MLNLNLLLGTAGHWSNFAISVGSHLGGEPSDQIRRGERARHCLSPVASVTAKLKMESDLPDLADEAVGDNVFEVICRAAARSQSRPALRDRKAALLAACSLKVAGVCRRFSPPTTAARSTAASRTPASSRRRHP
jgi:hypothetical protein